MNNIISFKSDFGWVSLEEKSNKVLNISFCKKNNKGKSKILKKLKKNLINYFSGKTKKLNLNLLINGSKLQIKIWNELKKIPFGETRSYGFIAKKIKTSPRYVGTVCGQNKHVLIIPCHRVIRSDGKLGGFSGYGGLKLKKRLLDLEQT